MALAALSLTGSLSTVGSSSSLGSAGSSSARHLVSGACGEATPELPALGHCCSFADPLAANLEGAVTFEAPDLPEETLMEVRPGLPFGWSLRASGGGLCIPGRSHPPTSPCVGIHISAPCLTFGFPQQEHTEILHSLRFTLAFVQQVLEIAALKGNASEAAVGPEYQLQESMVADQISLLSREWGWVLPEGREGGSLGPTLPLTCSLPSASRNSWCCT